MSERRLAGQDLIGVGVLLAEMERRIADLSLPIPVPERAIGLRALHRGAMALIELSLRCHADECVRLATGLAELFRQAPVAAHHETQVAAALETVGVLRQRFAAIGEAASGETTPTTTTGALPVGDGDGEMLAGLTEDQAWAFDETREEVGDEALADEALADEALTDDERALVRSFQTQPLRTSLSAAPTSGQPAEARVDEAGPLAPHVERGQAAGHLSLANTSSTASTAPAPAQSPAISSPRGPQTGSSPAWRAPTAEELDYIPPEMKRLFAVETADDLQDLRITLLKYEQRSDDASALSTMGRIAHKIRGTAGTLGFDVLATLTFLFEDLVKALQTHQVEAGHYATSVLVRSLVLLQSALDAASAEREPDAALVQRAQEMHDELLGARNSRAALMSAGHPGHPQASPALAPGVTTDTATSAPVAEVSEASSHLTRSAESESLLRVDVHRLDELMNHISALTVNRAAMMQARDSVVRLQTEVDHSLAKLSELTGQMTDLHPLVQLGAGALGEAPAGSGTHPKRSGPSRVFGGRIFGRAGREDAPAEDGPPQWDELELERFTEFDHALRVMSEVIADLSTMSRSLRTDLSTLAQLSEAQARLAMHVQHDVMNIRLVPLSDMVPRLHVEAHGLASAVGKSVKFTVRGEITQIDRNISEALTEPLIQLVRNAIVHGIESEEERLERGKPAVGEVWMHAYYVGSEVIIEIGDDGQGINPHLLAASAFTLGLLDAATARDLPPLEALDLMFVPGITTFDKAQVIGGRGIGLDQVRAVIQHLKGSIHVRSEIGQGCIFRIRVPISLSIVRTLHVRASGQHYAVPFSSVLRTVTLSPFDIITTVPVAGADTLTHSTPMTSTSGQRIRIERGERGEERAGGTEQEYDEIPLFALAELLGVEHTRREMETAIVVEAGRQRVALLVDEVLDDQEVVVQSLPRHLRRRSVRGATVMPDGQLLLLLDLPELCSDVLAGAHRRVPLQPHPISGPAQTLAPRVLVVDDSVSIRRTLELTLSRADFEVELASDGIEALEMMLVRMPRVVVLDIEMPRLDGFELLSILRSSPQFAEVPVVMLTSRATEKHREHALHLGAQAYLIKPCPQEVLVETVRGLLGEPVEIR